MAVETELDLSLTGKRWRVLQAPERLALHMQQQFGLADQLARILAARGIAPEEVPGFLTPRLRDQLPDPSGFKDMEAACARVEQALRTGEAIALFGDYDVDGATSSALLLRFFRALGQAPRLYIPDRQSEGYGPNPAAMRQLAQEGASLLLTLDCGVTAFDALDAAQEVGLDVIVLDHHQAEPKLPPAVAVVNPNRLDETGVCGHLAAVGVCFLFLVALNRHLRQSGFYAETGLAAPDLTQWLDLVALGTVCDVVPLRGLNRVFVAQGLKVMAQGGNPGLTALAQVGRMEGTPEAWHAGFVLGPRINAGGRLGTSDYGARLLATDQPEEAQSIAAALDKMNDERKTIEQDILQAAQAQAAESFHADMPIILVAGVGWHPGVIGIVASRIKDQFHRPSLIAAIDEASGRVTGSGRSIAGIDLGAAIIAARQAGLLLGGGGHAMAAGFTAEQARLDAFHAFMTERLQDKLTPELRHPELVLDLALSPRAATLELAEALQQLAPFGMGNAEPRLLIRNAMLHNARTVGGDDSHVSCHLGDPAGGSRLKAIAFSAMQSELGPALTQNSGRPMDLTGTIRIDTWQGNRRPQLQITDGRWSV